MKKAVERLEKIKETENKSYESINASAYTTSELNELIESHKYFISGINKAINYLKLRDRK